MDLVLTRGREGVQNPKNLADVICTCPQTWSAAISDSLYVVSSLEPFYGRGRQTWRQEEDGSHHIPTSLLLGVSAS